jgi:hypothetical protein
VSTYAPATGSCGQGHYQHRNLTTLVLEVSTTHSDAENCDIGFKIRYELLPRPVMEDSVYGSPLARTVPEDARLR